MFSTRLRALVLAALGIAGSCILASAQTGDDFYKGKQLSVMIGYGVGGSDDLWARLEPVEGASRYAIYPPLLDEYGLGAALGWYAEEFSRRTGIAVVLRDGKDAAADLRPEAAVALFRIAQEALNNVAKHAGARQVRIELAREAEEIVIRVADDGAGFDTAAAARGKRWGMKTMRERAEAAGGRLEVDSAPGEGTIVRASVRR